MILNKDTLINHEDTHQSDIELKVEHLFNEKKDKFILDESLKEQLNEDFEEQLTEATLGDLADEEVSKAEIADAAVDGQVHDPNALEYVLDRALRSNLAMKKREAKGKSIRSFVNILVTGGAGIGKTSRIEQWADSRNLRFVNKDVKSLDATDIGGLAAPNRETGKKVDKLTSTEFDTLDFIEGDDRFCVLFLDEFNRGKPDIRGSLLTLINQHTIPDATQPKGYRYLDGLLFTVAAINPGGGDDTGNYNVDTLDAAERSRFYIVNMKASNYDSLKYLTDQYKADLAVEDDPEEQQRIRGRLGIATTLLKSGKFVFDDTQEEAIAQEDQTNILNPRSFTQALEMSDGTKDDFLDWWNGMCNPNKKDIMVQILADYKDVNNKANSVFKAKPNSKFKNQEVRMVDADDDEDEDDDDEGIFKGINNGPSALDKLLKWKEDNGYN